MPLDHFVSQVHLRNFYSPILGNRMFAIRKTDLKAFTPDAHSVCRVEDGSTNEYLVEERAIEEFLKGIEPKYNRAIENITENDLRSETIYVLSGFIAYVLTCSPAGMRIHSEPFRGAVEETGRLLDRRGESGMPPPELGGASLTELLDSGQVQIAIDPKYPQAVGVTSILQRLNAFGNFGWEILVNTSADCTFFTSDFPIAVERTADPRIINRIIPLSPKLAVRIHPNLSHDTSTQDLSFKGFRRVVRKPSRVELMRINTLLVRCAESLVFYRDAYDWIPRFIRKNSKYRIESHTQRVPHGTGTILLSSLQICTV